MVEDKELQELQEDVSPTQTSNLSKQQYDKELGGSTRMDGVSTTSLEETASDPFSDEFLRIDAAGFCGLLERIPLTLKLVIMILVSLVGFIAIGVFLLVLQAQQIRQARLSNTFQSLSSDLGRVISATQEERELANQYLVSNFSNPAESAAIGDLKSELERSYIATDLLTSKIRKVIGDYNLYSYSVMVKELSTFNTTLSQMSVWRVATLDRTQSTTNTFTYYNNLIIATLDLLGRFVYIKGRDPTISSYLLLMRMIEQEYQLKAAGVLAGTQKVMTYFRFRGFVKFSGVRDDILLNWQTTTAPSVVSYYKSLVSDELIKNLRDMFEYAIANRAEQTISATLPLFDLESWNGNYTLKLNALSLVESRLRSNMKEESRDQLQRSAGIIVGVIVLIVFFFLLSTVVSVTVAYTIVGPWRRLNMIQDIAISKFVPKGLLKLLNCAKITDVALGLFTERQLTMMNVDIKRFTKASRQFTNSADIFEFLNTYLNYIGPLIRKHGGFIHSYNGDGFTALFTDSSKGVKAGIEIQSAIETFNSIHNKYPNISVAIGVHSAKVLVGTVGENERMEGTVLGSHNHVPSLLEKLTKKFNTKTLATRTTVANLNNKVGRQLDQRKIGVLLCEDEKGEKQEMDVIELTTIEKDTKKDQAKNHLERGVNAFYLGVYTEAISHFNDVLAIYPGDTLAQSYKARAEQNLDRIKFVSADWVIGNTLRNQEMMRGFEAFSHSEHSGENIAFWKQIEVYKTRDASERRLLASKMANDYLSLAGNYTININEKLKQDVNDQLRGTGNVGVDLFNQIQVELEVLMADTYKRYKSSNYFLEAFHRTPQAPQRPYLDDL